jgi:competence protein ComEA
LAEILIKSPQDAKNRRKEVLDGEIGSQSWAPRSRQASARAVLTREEKLSIKQETRGENRMSRHPKSRILLSLLALALLAGAVSAAAKGKVNINTADAEALALLPRIGSVVAKRIVEFRQENGDFNAAEDLMLVQGIGERTFELMEPYIALAGDTTLQEKVRVARDSSDEDG